MLTSERTLKSQKYEEFGLGTMLERGKIVNPQRTQTVRNSEDRDHKKCKQT